jgi:hypothetical protein
VLTLSRAALLLLSNYQKKPGTLATATVQLDDLIGGKVPAPSAAAICHWIVSRLTGQLMDLNQKTLTGLGHPSAFCEEGVFDLWKVGA